MINDKPIIIVLTAPESIKKDFLSKFSNSELITVACPEPMPGRKEKKGTMKMDANVDLKNSDLVRVICFNGKIICLFIFVDDFRERISDDKPNSPDSNGSKGCSIGRLNVSNPRNPAKRKMIRLVKICFSLKIR